METTTDDEGDDGNEGEEGIIVSRKGHDGCESEQMMMATAVRMSECISE